jgi:hypothetical protein
MKWHAHDFNLPAEMLMQYIAFLDDSLEQHVLSIDRNRGGFGPIKSIACARLFGSALPPQAARNARQTGPVVKQKLQNPRKEGKPVDIDSSSSV